MALLLAFLMTIPLVVPHPAEAATSQYTGLRVACYDEHDSSTLTDLNTCFISVDRVNGKTINGSYVEDKYDSLSDNLEPIINLGDNGYLTTTSCWSVSESANCGTFSLKDPPATSQSASITQIPTTGAPSSDLIIPAVVVASGMVCAGVLVSRRRRCD